MCRLIVRLLYLGENRTATAYRSTACRTGSWVRGRGEVNVKNNTEQKLRAGLLSWGCLGLLDLFYISTKYVVVELANLKRESQNGRVALSERPSPACAFLFACSRSFTRAMPNST
jgi:hypothetical protein